MNDEYFLRFPSVLKNAIQQYGLVFPQETMWEYEPLTAFRGIKRKDTDDLNIKNEDFFSYAEKGKKVRGKSLDEKDIEQYSCSCFLTKKELEVGFKLPRPNRRIIKGIIYDSKGCILINSLNGHIHWWIYENASPEEDFEVMNDE